MLKGGNRSIASFRRAFEKALEQCCRLTTEVLPASPARSAASHFGAGNLMSGEEIALTVTWGLGDFAIGKSSGI